MEIELKLTAQEVKNLFDILGQLPSSSGVYPLMVKIKDQAEAQMEQPANEVVNP
jgi:hypothetical protein